MKRHAGKYPRDEYISHSEMKTIQGLTRRKPAGGSYKSRKKIESNIFDVVASFVSITTFKNCAGM